MNKATIAVYLPKVPNFLRFTDLDGEYLAVTREAIRVVADEETPHDD